MRRFIFGLFLLAIAVMIGLVIYAYVAELPAPTRTITAPAAPGVGFGQ